MKYSPLTSPKSKALQTLAWVIREAMRSTGTVGIARLVMYRRERAVMLIPHGKGIVLWTLRYGDEVHDAADYFADISEAKPDDEALKLVAKLIKSRNAGWDAKLVEDPVQEKLQQMIAAKQKGRKPARKPKADAPKDDGKVVSIIDALKRSVAVETRGKR